MAPRAVKTIVAHEFKVSPLEVESWSYQQFLDACQLLAEKRVGSALRKQQLLEDQKMARTLEAFG